MIKIFNSNYEEIGDLNKNLALHTLGKIKIRYGRKYIDLLNDKGELNVNIPKILLEKDSLDDINSNGFYLVDGNLYAYYNGNIYQITSSEEGNFISFSDELNLSLEYINIALKNIGLKFNSIDEALSNIDNGIFFVGDKIYYNDGDTVKELTLKEPLSSINNENLGVPINNKVVLAYINGKWQYALYLSKDDIISIVKQYSGGKGLELNTPLEEINNAELDDPSVKKVSEIEPIEYDDDTTLPTVIAYNKTGTDESGKDVNSWYYETVVPFSIFKQCCEYMKLKIEELEQKIEDMIPKKVIWWWTETDMNNNELKYHEALVMKNQIPTWEDYQDPDSKNYTGTYIDSTKKFNLWNEDWTTTPITSDTNYFALWDNKEYWTVRWLKNEQDTPEGEFVTSVMDGEIATIPATLPEIEGKVFLKWDYDNTPITQNTDIYALWNDIKLFIKTNHLVINGQGDLEKTIITYWVLLGDEIITENVQLVAIPQDNPIEFTNELDEMLLNGKYTKSFMASANNSASDNKYLLYKVVYNNLESDILTITQAKNGEILMPPFDYMTFTYTWEESNGRDLDSMTIVTNSDIPIGDKTLNDYAVGWGCNGNGDPISQYLLHGGDNKDSGDEGALINFRKIIEDMSQLGLLDNKEYIYVDVYGNWYGEKGDGNMTINFKTYTGSTGMTKDGFIFKPNPGTEESGEISIDNNVKGFGKISGYTTEMPHFYTKIALVVYNIKTKTAVLNKITDWENDYLYLLSIVKKDDELIKLEEFYSKDSTITINLDNQAYSANYSLQLYQNYNGVITPINIDTNKVYVTYYHTTEDFATLSNVRYENGILYYTLSLTEYNEQDSLYTSRDADVKIEFKTNNYNFNCMYKITYLLHKAS